MRIHSVTKHDFYADSLSKQITQLDITEKPEQPQLKIKKESYITQI
jgi:hypothetical protein